MNQFTVSPAEVKAEECATCGAQPTRRCTDNGEEIFWSHRARIDAATRRKQARLEGQS